MRCLLPMFCFLLLGCQSDSQEPEKPLLRVESQRHLMGTLFRVVTYTENPDRAHQTIEDAFDQAQQFADAATDYDPKSELNLISQAPINTPVKLSPALFEVLLLAHRIAVATHGAYDPTLGPLTHLWRTSRTNRSLPTQEELEAAKQRCGFQHLILNPKSQTATLTRDKMQLDLGGIAKGFAADLIFDQLHSAGLTHSLVAAAGDIRLGDAPPKKTGWAIALRTFRLTPTEPILLANCAISTSGDLYQRIRIGEKSYSHLIDPQTGLGLTSRRAASVIAPLAQLTDPLATAACLIDDPNLLTEHFPEISLRVLYEDKTRAPVVTGIFLEKQN